TAGGCGGPGCRGSARPRPRACRSRPRRWPRRHRCRRSLHRSAGRRPCSCRLRRSPAPPRSRPRSPCTP
ncbi:MAG: hypothetical protein E6G07_08405, partial [Actinobacteria bacterium]